jgi:hypothetical protein
MSLPNFDDSGINGYFAGASRSEIESFIDDLKSDFDNAVTSRFDLNEDYAKAVENTPNEVKEFITDAVAHYAKLKESYNNGTFTVEGFGESSGNPEPLLRPRIRCWLEINGGVTFGCEISKG